MNIQFTQDYKHYLDPMTWITYEKGAILHMDEAVAKELIKLKVARKVKDEDNV